MHKYYCQIAALPELTFDPINKSVGLSEFLNEITPYLHQTHLNWLNMLMMTKGHKSILEYFKNGSAENETSLLYSLDWLDPEFEQFNLLPAYLQRFSGKFWQKKSDPGTAVEGTMSHYQYIFPFSSTETAPNGQPSYQFHITKRPCACKHCRKGAPLFCTHVEYRGSLNLRKMRAKVIT